MKIKSIAKRLLEMPKLDYFRSDADPDGKDREHIHWMLTKIADGDVKGDKGHRWLGYAQGLIVSQDIATLNEMKAINKTYFT